MGDSTDVIVTPISQAQLRAALIAFATSTRYDIFEIWDASNI